jgi:hypothetical protein
MVTDRTIGLSKSKSSLRKAVIGPIGGFQSSNRKGARKGILLETHAVQQFPGQGDC